MVFHGTYEHVIDAKNRLAIPAGIRAQLQSEAERSGSGIELYVTIGEGQALCLYTKEGFERRAEELDHSEMDSDELLAYERLLFSLTQHVEPDKQGRILLPETLLQRIGIAPRSKVVLIGAKDHLEVRDRDAWNEYVQQVLDRQPGILMNPRRAMRKRSLTA